MTILLIYCDLYKVYKNNIKTRRENIFYPVLLDFQNIIAF